ncbi:DgyrCDS8724 [Dimorphilus gyrociliatus]|uniref:DgyrCDS8724 n=1 Tax=Dimorphilus gyrociliatus TaxID=2664684 RepID=A0A7I8VW19_9ANNE|nr:DgyrCDS8724 [Dimorphilus gyrociliatus]
MSTTAAPEELTEEQIELIKDMFMVFDQDGDETITIKELGTVMRALGQHPTEAELNAIIAEIDADGNGIIEFPEFVDLMSRRPWGKLGSDEELRGAFQVFDKGNDGTIDVKEIRSVLTGSGEKLTDEQLDELLNTLTPDGEGKLRYEDMVKIINDI